MELGSKRFADAVVLYPVGRIDHATADAGDRRLGSAPYLLLDACGVRVRNVESTPWDCSA
jgi:hypothetical protein